MKGHLFSVLQLVVSGSMYFYKHWFIVALLGILFTWRMILFRKKVLSDSGEGGGKLPKIATTIIFVSGLGAIAGLAAILLHLKAIGHNLITTSFFLMLAGFFMLMILSARPGIIPIPLSRRQRVNNTIVYLFCTCSVTGILLTLHHYSGGKLLMLGGVGAIIVFTAFTNIVTEYKNNKGAI